MVRHRILVPIFAGSSPATAVMLMADEKKCLYWQMRHLWAAQNKAGNMRQKHYRGLRQSCAEKSIKSRYRIWKRGSFDDYYHVRDNCFSTRGTDCHSQKVLKRGIDVRCGYVRVFISGVAYKAWSPEEAISARRINIDNEPTKLSNIADMAD